MGRDMDEERFLKLCFFSSSRTEVYQALKSLRKSWERKAEAKAVKEMARVLCHANPAKHRPCLDHKDEIMFGGRWMGCEMCEYADAIEGGEK